MTSYAFGSWMMNRQIDPRKSKYVVSLYPGSRLSPYSEVKWSCSQCMFEMFCFACNADSQSLVPFLDFTVDHSLIKTVSLLLDVLSQLFHILDLVPVNVVLQNLQPTVN